jgi:chromosome segregation protein
VELGVARLGTREAAIERDLSELPEPEAVPAAGSGDGRRGQLQAVQVSADTLRGRREVARRERDMARDAWLAAQAAAREAEDRHLGARRTHAVREARRLQLEASLLEQQSLLERLAAERGAIEPDLAAAREAAERAASQRADAETEREAARAALVDLERQVTGGAQLADLERAVQAAAIEASRHEDALSALTRERQLALDTLADAEAPGDAALAAIAPELSAEIEALEPPALEQELRRVRRTLSQIGSVNPFAVEEHRELAARLDDLSTQEADLAGAIAATEELIARLDSDVAERFNAAFAAIGERFDEFCRLLFAGGSASLSVGDGTDGEAPGGIEIVVRPPGKRLQRLAMLSGGERALTGVALLFAMLSVNPVPFCILDEVDAALDEANIGRFADALRRLAQDIDFVVITHNRATIEVADTIYGVTMSDAAVSAVVSLRLADLPLEAVPA